MVHLDAVYGLACDVERAGAEGAFTLRTVILQVASGRSLVVARKAPAHEELAPSDLERHVIERGDRRLAVSIDLGAAICRPPSACCASTAAMPVRPRAEAALGGPRHLGRSRVGPMPPGPEIGAARDRRRVPHALRHEGVAVGEPAARPGPRGRPE